MSKIDCPNDVGLKRAIAAAGTRTELARKLEITKGAVHQWHQIPLSRVQQVAKVTGIPVSELRPDLFETL